MKTKRRISRGLLIVAVVLSLMIITACDTGDYNSNAFLGTWYGTHSLGWWDGYALGGTIKIVIEESTFTTALTYGDYAGYTETVSGVYTHNGNNATFIASSGEGGGTGSISGNTLTINVFIDGQSLPFILTKSENISNPFIGTWDGTDVDGDSVRLIVENSTWTLIFLWSNGSEPNQTGTYTYSGNTATIKDNTGSTIGTATLSGNILTITGKNIPWSPYVLIKATTSSGDNSSIVGTWKGSWTEDGYTVNVTLVFKSDGTGTMIQSYDGQSYSEDFTWTQDGTTVTIVEYDYESSFTFKGGNSFTLEGIILTRQ